MKFWEIKLEALRIMNINYDEDLKVDEGYLSVLSQPKYAKYLVNMDNSILRAVDYIVASSVLGHKMISLLPLKKETNFARNRFDLDLVEDFFRIVKIVYEDDKGFDDNVPFNLVSDELIVSAKYNPEYLSLIYEPKIVIDINNMSYESEFPIDDKFARIIPYFIKFDLYQEDEPNLASLAKQTFDSMLFAMKTNNQSQTESVVNQVYREE